MQTELVKLLIVDDDNEIRTGLCKGVDWEALGYYVIAEAGNGIEAINRIEDQMPDVILTDIHMDQMDGMQLIDYVTNNYPSIKIVLLSGYSDIDYYKRALEYKVFDFILKPTHLNDFHRVFSRLKIFYDEENLREKSYQMLKQTVSDMSEYTKKNDMIAILDGKVRTEMELNSILEKNHIDILKGKVFIVASTFESEIEGREVKAGIKNLLLDAAGELSHAILEKKDNLIVMIVHSKESETFTKKYKEIYENYVRADEIVFSGVSQICDNLINANQFYKQAYMCMRQISYIPAAKIVLFDELKNMSQVQKLNFDSSLIINSLLFKYDDVWKKEIEKVLQVFHGNVSMEYDYLDCICNNLYYEIVKNLEVIYPYDLEYDNFYEVITSITNLEEKRKLMFRVYEIMQILAKDSQPDGRNKTVVKIDEIIDSNFKSSQLSLTYLGEVLERNTAYLSNLYKQETKNNITDVITKKRIKYAQELLQNTNLKTYKIAEEIGYADCSYFTKLFKKNVGLSPNEYRNTFRK